MVWVSLEMCYHVRDAKKHQVIVLLHPPPSIVSGLVVEWLTLGQIMLKKVGIETETFFFN